MNNESIVSRFIVLENNNLWDYKLVFRPDHYYIGEIDTVPLIYAYYRRVGNTRDGHGIFEFDRFEVHTR